VIDEALRLEVDVSANALQTKLDDTGQHWTDWITRNPGQDSTG